MYSVNSHLSGSQLAESIHAPSEKEPVERETEKDWVIVLKVCITSICLILNIIDYYLSQIYITCLRGD